MTQEEKQLLLIDLCAKLPYGVKVQPSGSAAPHKFKGYDKGLARTDTDQRYELENIKPYLRPMSSMTDEELLNIVQKDNEKYHEEFVKKQQEIENKEKIKRFNQYQKLKEEFDN